MASVAQLFVSTSESSAKSADFLEDEKFESFFGGLKAREKDDRVSVNWLIGEVAESTGANVFKKGCRDGDGSAQGAAGVAFTPGSAERSLGLLGPAVVGLVGSWINAPSAISNTTFLADAGSNAHATWTDIQRRMRGRQREQGRKT